METLLYGLSMAIARIHAYILTLNNQFEYYFTDKELHFLVMGAVGLIMVLLIHPIFKWLSDTGHIMVVTFLYVFTVIIVITFAIEIGQRITGTGNMESADIAWGIMGFLCAFAVFAAVRGIIILIKRSISKGRR